MARAQSALPRAAEYHKEEANQTSDAISNGTPDFSTVRGVPGSAVGARAGGPSIIPSRFREANDVKELYTEINVPVLKDSPIARSLDFNAAARYAEYSLQGNATS